MGKVIRFPEREDDTPHFSALAVCLVCFKTWIATISTKNSLFKLQCPKCGKMKSFASFLPDEYMEEFKNL